MIGKVKTTIQHLILKSKPDSSNPIIDKGIWNTPQLRDLLKQQIPQGDLIIDDQFMNSSQLSGFSPCLDTNEFHKKCNELLEFIKENEKFHDEKIKSQPIETMQVFNFQKYESELPDNLKDFCQFLGQKSLGSKSYLDVNLLYRSQESQVMMNTSNRQQAIEDNKKLSQFSQDVRMIDQVNQVITLLSRNQTLQALLSNQSTIPCIDSQTFIGLVKTTVDKQIKLQPGELERIEDTIISLLKLTKQEKQQLLIASKVNGPAVPQTTEQGQILELISLKSLQNLWPQSSKSKLAS